MFFYHGRLFVFDSSIRLIRDVLNILHVCVEMFSICVDLKWPCMKYVQYHQRQKRCTMPFLSFYQTAEEKNCNKNKSKTKLSSIAFAYSWSLECSWMSAFMWNASLKLLFNFLAYPISFPSSIGRFFVGPLLHARNMRWIVWAFFGLRDREREDTQHTNYKIQTCSAYVERNKCDAEWSVSVFFLNIFQKIPLQNRFFLNICIYTPHPHSMQKERKWKI